MDFIFDTESKSELVRITIQLTLVRVALWYSAYGCGLRTGLILNLGYFTYVWSFTF